MSLLTLLLIENDAGDCRLIGTYLNQTGQSIQLRFAHCLADALAFLAETSVDVLLADLHLPDATGLAVIDALWNAAPHTPLLVLTARDDPKQARRLIERGAQDYLNKQELTPGLLKRAIYHAIERQRLRRQLENSLARTRESEAHLAHAQALARIGSWTLDIPSGIVEWSLETFRIFGLSPEEGPLTLSKVFERIHPEDRPVVEQAWQAALAGAPYDIEHRLIVGDRVKWIRERAELEYDAHGVPVRGIGTAQDITIEREARRVLAEYQKQLEIEVAARTAELRQRDRYQRAVLDNFPFLVWLKDPENRFLAVNQPFAEACGCAVEEVTGKTDWEIWPLELAAQYRAADREVLATLQKKIVEEEVDTPEGRVWFETYRAPVLDSDGTVLGTVGFAHDITERKRAEAAARQAVVESQRLAQLRSDFLANMSHEIRTPLNVIIGLAQAARRQPFEAAARRYFDQIEEASQLLLGVVNDILDFSKIEAGKLELEQTVFSLGETIDQALAMIAPRAYGKGLTLNLVEAADLPEACCGDAFRLTQILVNLLSNAVKFTEQGEVCLTVDRTSDAEGREGIRFRVEDTGPGLTLEQQQRLFQPFEQGDSSTTRRFGGTGLGLAICKRLVEMMAGVIRAVNRPERGAVFEVWLPLAATSLESTTVSVTPKVLAIVELSSAEATSLLTALNAQGHIALELPACGLGEVTGFDLIVVESSVLTDPCGLRAVFAVLERGMRVAVVVTPGTDPVLPGRLRERVALIDRPLSARRVLNARHLTQEGTSVTVGPRLAGVRVLAVEDNPVNQLVLTELLSQEGAIVTLTGHGAEALERVQAHGAGAFDLVLTDIQMPIMDGYETARRLREQAPQLPVIGLTARAMPEERERCLAAGMCDHVAKPVDIDELVTVVQRHLEPRGTTASGRETLPSVPGMAPPIVDWAMLERQFQDSPDFIGRLVTMTQQTQADAAVQLRKAALEADWERLVFLTHDLKGVGGHLHALRVQDLARRAETAARQADPNAALLAIKLADAVEELLGELAQYDPTGMVSEEEVFPPAPSAAPQPIKLGYRGESDG